MVNMQPVEISFESHIFVTPNTSHILTSRKLKWNFPSLSLPFLNFITVDEKILQVWCLLSLCNLSLSYDWAWSPWKCEPIADRVDRLWADSKNLRNRILISFIILKLLCKLVRPVWLNKYFHCHFRFHFHFCFPFSFSFLFSFPHNI